MLYGRLHLALSEYQFAIMKKQGWEGIVALEAVMGWPARSFDGLANDLVLKEIGVKRGFRSDIGDFGTKQLQLC